MPQGGILYSGQLADTADHAIYTPAAGTSVQIETATASNTSGSSANLTLSLVPAGGTADGTHRILSAVAIAAGATLVLKDDLDGVILGSGDSIHAQASAGAAIDLVITGRQ